MYNTKIVADICSKADPKSSYVDIGPVWGTINESLTAAKSGGLTDLNIIDFSEEKSLYTLILYLKSKGIHRVTVYNSDVLKHHEGQFDIGYCSGILYHIPYPHDLFSAFARIIKHTLILHTLSIPKTVIKDLEILHIKQASESEIQSVIDYWNKYLSFKHGLAVNQNLTNLADYSKYWNAPTPEYLEKMCVSYGFSQNIQIHSFDNGGLTTIVAHK